MKMKFTIVKNDYKKDDSQPDYIIRQKVGEEYKRVGACWLKDGNKGKYFSCAYDDEPYQAEKTYQPELGEADPDSIPF